MADLVRSGAIFRVRGASTRQSPMPATRTTTSARRSSATRDAVAPVAKKVMVSALEAASSSSLGATQRASRSSASKSDVAETPLGMPRRKARLQQTPNLRSSARKIRSSAEIARANPRNAAEIEANFNRLVMKTPVTKARTSKSAASAFAGKPRSLSGAPSSSGSEQSKPKPQQPHTRSSTRRNSDSVPSSPSSNESDINASSSGEEPSSGDGTAKRRKLRHRSQLDVPTALRSSARVKAQRNVPVLPLRDPIVRQTGNTEEDEELLHIQKRLFFSHRPKRRQQSNQDMSDSDSEIDDESDDENGEAHRQQQQQRVPSSRPRREQSTRQQSDSKTTRKLATSVSILEEVAALPKAKKTASAETLRSKQKSSMLVLCDWTLQWPPVYEARDGYEKEQLRLVLEGQVLGRHAAFNVARRVSASQFMSSENESVRLEGGFDIAKAKRNGVPSPVMDIMADGVPAHWRRKFEAILHHKTPVRDRRKRTEEESEPEPEDEDEPETKSVKRSRSGRIITPVMDWWRGERLKTDVNGVTVIDHGSPAFIASEREQQTATKSVRSTAKKPPRVPIAPKTPVAAKTPVTTKKTPVAAKASTTAKASAAKAKQGIKNAKADEKKRQMAPSSDASEWSEIQLQALANAKMHVPTTAANFWAEVATYVAGKSASECRTKSFADFASPTSRTQKKRSSETPAVAPATQIPTKLFRAGSNLFKKQVRQFVEQYEKKHVDDLFSNTTPSKSELQGTMGLDDIKSPGAPLDTSANLDEDSISNEDDLISGRGLFEKITSNKRDEVDSYVLSLKRNRLVGEPATPSSKRVPAFQTPTTAKKKKKPTVSGVSVHPTKRAVHMYTDVGSHRVEGVVSPGGTTHVRIQKDSDATSEDEDEYDSDEEHSSDGFF